jgi:hypothetical protein
MNSISITMNMKIITIRTVNKNAKKDSYEALYRNR